MNSVVERGWPNALDFSLVWPGLNTVNSFLVYHGCTMMHSISQSATGQNTKPWPNALDFSLYNARHSCIVKCRERLATLYSEVERVLLCRVKFDKSQIFERCRVLSRAFGHPTIQSRAHARAVAAVFYIIGKSFLVNNIEATKAPLYHWFLLKLLQQ